MQIDMTKVRIMAEDLGWSQRTLARRAGVDPSVLSRLARTGKAYPSTVLLIASALGVGVPDIAAGRE